MRKLTHSELINLRHNINSIENIEKHPIKVLLYNIRSMYNVGSIFRTADSSLIDEVILCGFTPYPPREEIDKTALGATQTVKWRYYNDIKDSINELKKNNWKVCALELTNESRDYNNIELNEFPIAIIVGNEISGIDDDILDLCDFSIAIPMYGVKHSLNVSVATGIAIYNTINILKKGIK